jgi:hypothetical protein
MTFFWVRNREGTFKNFHVRCHFSRFGGRELLRFISFEVKRRSLELNMRNFVLFVQHLKRGGNYMYHQLSL